MEVREFESSGVRGVFFKPVATPGERASERKDRTSENSEMERMVGPDGRGYPGVFWKECARRRKERG
jgi:hypothetical protein